MNTHRQRIVLRTILVIVIAIVLRAVVLGLDKMECGISPFKQFEFICDMGWFVLPVLLTSAFLGAAIPYMTLADRREQIARVWQFLLIPSVVNSLLRGVDFLMLEDCVGDLYYTDESLLCLVLFFNLLILPLPTLAAIIFVSLTGWKLLFLQEMPRRT